LNIAILVDDQRQTLPLFLEVKQLGMKWCGLGDIVRLAGELQ
jgi:hypothetical protein